MQPESQPKIGRPSDYTERLAEAICNRLAEGQSLRRICAADDMPHRVTVGRWLRDNADFRSQYALAREVQADQLADEILEIANDASRDVVTVGEGKSAYERERFTASARDKLKIDARFKLMALLAPKKYGTKLLDVTSGGEKLAGTNYDKLSKEALAEVLNATAPGAE